jgi:hypothetical protein
MKHQPERGISGGIAAAACKLAKAIEVDRNNIGQ